MGIARPFQKLKTLMNGADDPVSFEKSLEKEFREPVDEVIKEILVAEKSKQSELNGKSNNTDNIDKNNNNEKRPMFTKEVIEKAKTAAYEKVTADGYEEGR